MIKTKIEKKSININKSILRLSGRANAKYALIKEGDKVLLGLSGGKDSLSLAHALKHMQRVAPFDFLFEAATVSYGMGENFETLKEHCKSFDIKHTVINTKIFDLVGEKIRKNSSFCSFCSRMRRGTLYSFAQEHGFNKIALAHHLDDAAESFFMNFMNNGTIRSMAPIYKAENGLIVIRPFIHVRERQLRENAILNSLPVIGCEACPAMKVEIKKPHARARTKEILSALEKENPTLFKSLRSAFENIQVNSFCAEEFLDKIE